MPRSDSPAGHNTEYFLLTSICNRWRNIRASIVNDIADPGHYIKKEISPAFTDKLYTLDKVRNVLDLFDTETLYFSSPVEGHSAVHRPAPSTLLNDSQDTKKM